MIARIIRSSIANRVWVLLVAAAIVIFGVLSALNIPLDFLPELGETQVIIRAPFPGKSPQLLEDLVTFPLSTALLSVPGVKTVRGYSFFGDSFVYVIFEDGVDLYWARSRVLEYLSQVQSRLPQGVPAELGPDGTGLGWVYEYALVDRTGQHDLSQLRALNDWFLKYELKTVPDVAEVASIGGMVKQYQVVLDPDKLRVFGIPHAKVLDALNKANQESGGSVVEMAETEYMVRSRGYLRTLDDFRNVLLSTSDAGTPVTLRDVATVRLGPEMRRGIAELNGEGEVAGGVVVMRSGKNALETIKGVKARLETLKGSLPKGVEVVTTYDRSNLINAAIHNLSTKLIEEFIAVAVVCALFLFHFRSSLVTILSLPVAVLTAFIAMRYQGINANIMSLAGVGLAIGAASDSSLVLIEAFHAHWESYGHAHPNRKITDKERWEIVTAVSIEVGPALFISLLIVAFSFIPVFALTGEEGKLFAGLAYTKTYALAAAAGLSVTLVPVLMGYFIRGRIPSEASNPINRVLVRVYRPLLETSIRRPWWTIGFAVLALTLTALPMSKLGGEFMPMLEEGDLLYMPSALPGLSASKASELLQQTDRLIKTVPEVATVFGKAGRAESATDPAPMEMFETTIQLKPRDHWRPGMTPEKLVEELDRVVKVPGLATTWVPPIRNRISMVSTGIKTPVGVKVSGPELGQIDQITSQIENAVKNVPGVTSALAERLSGGRYIDVDIDRARAARYGLNVTDVQSVVSSAIGGENVGEVIDGRQRFPINVRYPQAYRDSVQSLREFPVVTDKGAQIRLSDVATVTVTDGPPMIRSENARLTGLVYIDVRGTDLRTAVNAMQAAVVKEVKLPPGYSMAWSGQYESMERAAAKLQTVIPMTLLLIFILLYLAFRSFAEAALLMLTVPFALVGAFWFIWFLGHAVSVATIVGLLALAGLAAEFGVIMLIYLRNALQQRLDAGRPLTNDLILEAIREGAVQRIRPKAMTVAVILAGLIPLMLGHSAGHEAMARLAAPMVGGVFSASLLSLLILPAAWRLLEEHKLRRANRRAIIQPESQPQHEGVEA